MLCAHRADLSCGHCRSAAACWSRREAWHVSGRALNVSTEVVPSPRWRHFCYASDVPLRNLSRSPNNSGGIGAIRKLWKHVCAVRAIIIAIYNPKRWITRLVGR